MFFKDWVVLFVVFFDWLTDWLALSERWLLYAFFSPRCCCCCFLCLLFGCSLFCWGESVRIWYAGSHIRQWASSRVTLKRKAALARSSFVNNTLSFCSFFSLCLMCMFVWMHVLLLAFLPSHECSSPQSVPLHSQTLWSPLSALREWFVSRFLVVIDDAVFW